MKYEAIVETGEVIVRELTTEEIAQDVKDREDAAKRQAIEDEKVAQKQNALAKLAALGLDAEDLKVLGLG